MSYVTPYVSLPSLELAIWSWQQIYSLSLGAGLDKTVNKTSKRIFSQSAGFEPALPWGIWFRVRRLNHSATTAILKLEYIVNSYQNWEGLLRLFLQVSVSFPSILSMISPPIPPGFNRNGLNHGNTVRHYPVFWSLFNTDESSTQLQF